MVTPLLLSQSDKQIRLKDITRTVLQCLHGLHSIHAALSSFADILSQKFSDTQPDVDIGGVFDAHVGDCACHMRVQMVLELISHFSTSPEVGRVLEERIIPRLETLKLQTASLLHQIIRKNGNARSLGFGPVISLSHILDAIGYSEFLTLLEEESMSSATSTLHSSPNNGSGSLSGSTPVSPASSKAPSDDLDQALRKLIISENKRADNHHPSEPGTVSSHQHRSLTVDTIWDPSNLVMVIRFLTFARLLSIAKVASLDKGPPARIFARTDPQYAYDVTEAGLEKLDLLGEGRSLQSIIRPGDKAKKTALNNEFEAIQVYLSQLTVDWSVKSAARCGLRSVINNHQLVATSSRQISCVATYASFLLIQAAWLTKGIPIFLVTQRFCSHGYHVLFHRITRDPATAQCRVESEEYLETMGRKDWFQVMPVEHEAISASGWAWEPHYIFICISTEGTHQLFYNRLVDTSLGPNTPHEGTCSELDQYATSIAQTNFSELLTHSFAQHAQFPFPLPGIKDEYEHVARILESNYGPKASRLFTEAWQAAGDFGTGPSARLSSPQHVYLELPGVVVKQVAKMLDKRERPGLIGYRTV